MAIQPLADRIVVKVLEAKEVSKGGEKKYIYYSSKIYYFYSIILD